MKGSEPEYDIVSPSAWDHIHADDVALRAAAAASSALVYGSLIYQLLGDKAQEQFSHDWAVGLGIDQATQWKEVVQSSIQAAIILTLLDRMGFMSGVAWLEGYLDQSCVQATMIGTAGLSWMQRLRMQMRVSMRLEAK